MNLPARFRNLVLLAFTILASGCYSELQTNPPRIDVPAIKPTGSSKPTEYRLSVGDTFDVKFFYNPELSEFVTVRPDGKIALQLVGELQAQGLTPKQLEENIKTAYHGIIRRPVISILARKFAAPKVFVGGEVANPGVVPIEGQLTVMQAIMTVGGFKTSAQVDNVVLLKSSGVPRPSYSVLDLEATLEQQRLADIELAPYDVVFVPKKKISEIATFFKENINEIFPFYKNSGITFPFLYYLNPGAINGSNATTK